ncbi:hypothetical protein GCM10010452_03860 [Crossiella cryophila]
MNQSAEVVASPSTGPWTTTPNLGLLTPAERTGGNYRPSDVEHIALVRCMEDQALPLEEIDTA